MEENILELCQDYCDFIKNVNEDSMFGLYGMDRMRSDIHDKICDLLKIDKERTSVYTNSLDVQKINYDGKKLYELLLKLKEEVKE
jgi:hypothetical protein